MCFSLTYGGVFRLEKVGPVGRHDLSDSAALLNCLPAYIFVHLLPTF